MQQSTKYDPLQKLRQAAFIPDAGTSAMYAFQQWLMSLKKDGLARVKDYVIILDPAVCERFVFGVANGRFFVGLQGGEHGWARNMPWTHAAYRRGSSVLNLVCDEFRFGSVSAERFAIEIAVANPRKLDLLATLDQIDLRAVDGNRSCAEAFGVLPLWILERGTRVLDLRIEAAKVRAAV